MSLLMIFILVGIYLFNYISGEVARSDSFVFLEKTKSRFTKYLHVELHGFAFFKFFPFYVIAFVVTPVSFLSIFSNDKDELKEVVTWIRIILALCLFGVINYYAFSFFGFYVLGIYLFFSLGFFRSHITDSLGTLFLRRSKSKNKGNFNAFF